MAITIEQTSLPIWEMGTHSRRKDPTTSHDAAEYQEKSGKANALCGTLLKMLRQHGEATTKELADVGLLYDRRLDYETIHKRMSDLHNADMVELTGEKRGGCRVWKAKA